MTRMQLTQSELNDFSLQAERWGAALRTEDVESVDLQNRPFTIKSSDVTVGTGPPKLAFPLLSCAVSLPLRLRHDILALLLSCQAHAVAPL